MWRDQSDRLVCNQHYVITKLLFNTFTVVFTFSCDYETLVTFNVLTKEIIEFRWNNSMWRVGEMYGCG